MKIWVGRGISAEPGSEGTGEGRIRGSFRGWPLGALRAPQLPTTATRGSSGLSGTSLRCPALRASPAGPPVRVPGPPRPRPAPSPPAPGALPASSPWRRVTARPASARLLPRLRPYANQLGGGGEAAGARPPPQQSCSRRSEARPLGPGARAGPGAVGSSRGELLGSPLPGAEGAECSRALLLQVGSTDQQHQCYPIRNAGSWASVQTYYIRICVLTRFSGHPW